MGPSAFLWMTPEEIQENKEQIRALLEADRISIADAKNF